MRRNGENPPQWRMWKPVARRSSASNQTRIPKRGRTLAANRRILRRLQEARRQVPRRRAPQKATALRRRPTQRGPGTAIPRRPPFRRASEKFPFQPWCRRQSRRRTIFPGRERDRVFFRRSSRFPCGWRRFGRETYERAREECDSRAERNVPGPQQLRPKVDVENCGETGEHPGQDSRSGCPRKQKGQQEKSEQASERDGGNRQA